MTKKSPKTTKKNKENIHSLYNQEFRFPSLLSRIKNWISKVVS